MTLKRSYTISLKEDMAERIEKVKKVDNLSYTEIFTKAIDRYLDYLDELTELEEMS